VRVAVIIPALDEVASIRSVVESIPRGVIAQVYVVDNGSTDRTAELARQAGAEVVSEPRRGYGSACLAGIAALLPRTEVVVFMDADGSDDPAQLPELIAPIARGEADLVVGSRTLGVAERGALTPQQRFGNALASQWLRLRYGLAATDLGPLRAIRRASLNQLAMSDRDYGWTVEMQIKAARARLRYREIPVRYRRRVGRSKISGTLRGTVLAGAKILFTLARYEFRTRSPPPR
jgi:glycosyltransferase involved in cell wall biosynthesis